ncbi:MAG: acyltransferase [Bacteroidetes bacterium]|nr:acyltransferase [Bacteroidota bacterium]
MNNPSRIQIVDILRGIAAIFVFIFHASALAGFDKRHLPPIDIFSIKEVSIPNFFSLGASGVSLFFVISGLVLMYANIEKEPLGIKKYYQNRFFRIVPAYWVSIIFSCFIYFIIPKKYPPATDVLSHVFFLHGLSVHYFLSINGALWSMVTEVQFYIIFPLMLYLYRKNSKIIILIASILVTLAVRYFVSTWGQDLQSTGSISYTALINYQIPGRLSEFSMGMFIAILLKKNIAFSRIIYLLTFPVFAITMFVRMYGPDFLSDVLFGITYSLITLFLINYYNHHALMITNWQKKLLNFGKISYSFFLIHLPILTFFSFIISKLQIQNLWLNFFTIIIISFPICFMLSGLLYKYIETFIYNKYRIS